MKDEIFKCRTVKRRAEEAAYESSMLEGLVARYEDYMLKGAKTTLPTHFPKQIARSPLPASHPTRGVEIVPWRAYLKPDDFNKHAFTQGCPGCANTVTY